MITLQLDKTVVNFKTETRKHFGKQTQMIVSYTTNQPTIPLVAATTLDGCHKRTLVLLTKLKGLKMERK